MTTVFLSHSSKDKSFVRELAGFLESGGDIKVWLDEREIDFGDNIPSAISKGLDADAVLLILSPDSVDSKYVHEEWTDAYWSQLVGEATKLAPVLLRDCKIPHLLKNKKRFDLRTNQPEGFRQIKTWLLGLRSAPPPPLDLPQRPPDTYIVREEQIKELRERMREPGSLAHVQGMPGLGKTTLALQYAHRHHLDFEAVYWLDCRQKSLALMAEELDFKLGTKTTGDLDTVLREVKAYLGRKHCLFILDNVESDEIEQLLPGGRACVLITTRHNNLKPLRSRHPQSLPLFTEAQCLGYFGEQLGTAEVSRNEDAAKALFRRLQYLPLGVAVAVALIREDVRYTLPSMVAKLPADVTALLKEAIAALSSDARALLQAMAACAPQGFRLSLAAAVAKQTESQSLDSLQKLRSRSLVDELDRSARRYQLHSLMREAAEVSVEVRVAHATEVATLFDTWEADWQLRLQDLGDLDVAVAWGLKQPHSGASWLTACNSLLRGYELNKRVGAWNEAFEKALRLTTSAQACNNAKVLCAGYTYQAIILTHWGRMQEAMELLKASESIALTLSDLTALQAIYGNQAAIANSWGKRDQAVELLKKQETICLELGERKGLLRSYAMQASALRAKGMLNDSMEMLKRQELIAIEINDLEGLHACYGNQALLMLDWNRLDEAMLLLDKEERIVEDIGDKEALLGIYGTKALVMEAWGRFNDALLLLQHQEDLASELGSLRHLQAVYGNQGMILKQIGKYEDAIRLQRKQEGICREIGDKQALQTSYGNQAIILGHLGRSDEALQLLDKKQQICVEIGHRSGLQACYGTRANIFRTLGRIGEALAT
ncbi:MAG: TIR domain-containing protein, partial [Acidobacteriales bacterium]|nr:TIR domain-containing protein [Terriglobales bacterium]